MPHRSPLPRLAAAIAALALAAPAAAADMAERRRAALHLVEASAGDALILRLSAGPVRQLLAASHALQPDLSAQQMTVLSALYHEEMHAAALAAMRDRAIEIAARYALPELEALRAFAATDEGLAALDEVPSLTGSLARAIEAAMLGRMDAALDRHGRGG